MPSYRVSYRLVQSHCDENHGRCGQLLVSVVWRKRQNERQNQIRLEREPMKRIVVGQKDGGRGSIPYVSNRPLRWPGLSDKCGLAATFDDAARSSRARVAGTQGLLSEKV